MRLRNEIKSFRRFRSSLFRIIFPATVFLFFALSAGQAEQIIHTDSLRNAQGIESKIEAIRLHWIKDGRDGQTLVSGKQIRESGGILEVQGYLSGLVAFCDADVTVQLENRPMSRIRNNGDGTYSAKYFGLLAPEAIPPKVRKNAYFESDAGRKAAEPDRSHTFLKGAYSYFPKVTADQIWPRQLLRLRFRSGEGVKAVKIRQKGAGLTPLAKHLGPDFYYQGNRLGSLKRSIKDFDLRLFRIAEGIGQVNRIFGTDLIDRVILIDYDGIRNAITCEEFDDIWFYIETFREEPVDELATIAAHETLHKYVDLRGFTKDRDIRTLFADLMGYSLFTRERFLLVTEGVLPRDASPANPKGLFFFDFINEKNFLKNRKGGHADENLDEFCTSFIHSLLHIDRLHGNLRRSIRAAGNVDYLEQPLTPAEAASVADNYRKTVAALRRELEKKAAPQQEQRFFNQCFKVSCRARQCLDDTCRN